MLRNRGFNLVEMLVSVGIVIALAGLVVPIVSMKRLDDQWEKVDRDLARIAAGVQDYVQATRTFPTGHSGATHFHFLYGDGVLPANNAFASGPALHLARFLTDGTMAGEGWKGPYLSPDIGADPWGRAYLVNVNGYFSSAERVVALCAGPNGQVETAPSATTAGGDDVIAVIE